MRDGRREEDNGNDNNDFIFNTMLSTRARLSFASCCASVVFVVVVGRVLATSVGWLGVAVVSGGEVDATSIGLLAVVWR